MKKKEGGGKEKWCSVFLYIGLQRTFPTHHLGDAIEVSVVDGERTERGSKEGKPERERVCDFRMRCSKSKEGHKQ